MAWRDDLRTRLPRDDIPAFLTELQSLVAALREGRPWTDRLTPLLRAHPDLVLGYLDPGPARDAVADALR